MKAAVANTAEHVNAYRAQITVALLAGAGICALFYAMSLYSLVSRTIAMRQTERATASLSGDVSSLDSQYLKLMSSVTPDMMADHGLSEGTVSAYIKLSQSTASIPALARGGDEL